MFTGLSEQLKEYARNQTSNIMRQYYNDTADALIDDDFIQTLSNTEILNRLEFLSGNFEYYISNQNNYNDALNLVHTGCRINGHMRKGGGSLAPSQARNSSSLFLFCFFSLCGKILSKILLWG